MMKKLMLVVAIISSSAFAGVTSWEDSPNNWENSEHNWDNSSNNWENNPNNWDSDRVIRDNSGNPTGYTVPKSNGGTNIYDLDGNREGYVN